MKKYRIFKFFNFFVPFFIACLIYLFYRQDIIIEQYEEWFPLFGKLRLLTYTETGSNWYWLFIKYYFPDMLWAYSLGCSTYYGYRNRAIKILLPILLGTTIEVCQYIGVLFGTGDILDIIIEIIGSYTACVVCEICEKHYGKVYCMKD